MRVLNLRLVCLIVLWAGACFSYNRSSATASLEEIAVCPNLALDLLNDAEFAVSRIEGCSDTDSTEYCSVGKMPAPKIVGLRRYSFYMHIPPAVMALPPIPGTRLDISMIEYFPPF